MNKKRRNILSTKFIVGVFLLLFVHSTFAFTQDSLSTVPYDSSDIDVRTADQQILQEITGEKVFEYNEAAQNPEKLWSRIQRWIFQTIIYILDNKWASFFIKIAFFVVFGIVLVALLNQLLGGNIHSAFSRKRQSQGVSIKSDEIDITKENLDKLLADAVAERRFSDAVRLLYLQSLQELQKAGLVNLKPEKTNHDYLRELDQHNSAPLFSRLTLFYEYVEYGDFRIEESNFGKVKKIYEQFKEKAQS